MKMVFDLDLLVEVLVICTNQFPHLDSLRLATPPIRSKAWQAIRSARSVVDEVKEKNEVAYGVNTGFGNFANVIIPDDKLSELQENLIRSHAAGVGELLSPQRVRML